MSRPVEGHQPPGKQASVLIVRLDMPFGNYLGTADYHLPASDAGRFQQLSGRGININQYPAEVNDVTLGLGTSSGPRQTADQTRSVMTVSKNGTCGLPFSSLMKCGRIDESAGQIVDDVEAGHHHADVVGTEKAQGARFSGQLRVSPAEVTQARTSFIQDAGQRRRSGE